MFRSARIRSSLFALVALLTVLSLPAGVSAKPFHNQFSDVIPEFETCGVVVTLELTINQVVHIDTETAFRSTGTGTFVFTAADGRSIVSKFAGQNAGTITENDDGTVTILETYNGVIDRISSTGDRRMKLRNVGFITVLSTVNLSTGDVTSEVIDPHGQLEGRLECDVFLAALG